MIFSEVFEFHSDWSLKICGITSLIHGEDQLCLFENLASLLKGVRFNDLHGCLARAVEDLHLLSAAHLALFVQPVPDASALFH